MLRTNDLLFLCAALLLILIGLLCFSVAYCADSVVQVQRVIDGDTLKATSNGTLVTLRLWGVDAPERQQVVGMDALRRLMFWTTQCPCTITEHGSGGHGRRAVQLFTKTRRDIGEQLIREGLAWWDARYAPNEIGYALAEVEARTYRRGLWDTGTAVAPWDWRRGER